MFSVFCVATFHIMLAHPPSPRCIQIHLLKNLVRHKHLTISSPFIILTLAGSCFYFLSLLKLSHKRFSLVPRAFAANMGAYVEEGDKGNGIKEIIIILMKSKLLKQV